MWADGTLLAFDTETTGVDTETDRIVTAAVVVIDGTTGAQQVHEWLIDPGVPIPAEAAAIHGVTTERARAEGRPPRQVVGEIVDRIAEVWRVDVPLIVYNAQFDLSLLDRELRRHWGEPWLQPDGLPVVDPLVIDKTLDVWRKGSRRLVDVARHYRVKLDPAEAHGATADALAAARVAWRQARVYPTVLADLAALHDKQIGWRQEQVEDLNRYWARRGKPAEARPEWPLLPYAEAAVA